MSAASQNPVTSSIGYVGKIPIRNVWLLMLYASELFRLIDQRKIAVEENPDDIPDLIAELLAHAVERRLRRNLTFGYSHREAALSRVRGRILLLETERGQLLTRGRVACRFEELTVDTPRNRFVRAALTAVSFKVRRPELSRRCRALAGSLRSLGVSGERPTRFQVNADRIGRHDAGDRFMIALAKLAFQLALPTEDEGTVQLDSPSRDIVWLRRLYESAVAGFYDVVLSPQGWRVSHGQQFQWQVDWKSEGIDAILPSMRTDIVLEHPRHGVRIVIDTKFNEILTAGWYREETIRSGYLYQMYAYLRSQEGRDAMADSASGTLLHPAVGFDLDESVEIQGHMLRFMTVDLSQPASEIRKQLLQVVGPQVPGMNGPGQVRLKRSNLTPSD